MASIIVKWNKSGSSLFFYFVRFWIFTQEEKDFESRTFLYCCFYLSIGSKYYAVISVFNVHSMICLVLL